MGAYSPAPIVTPELHDRIMAEVMHPIVAGLARRGIPYRGVLYAGMMITADGPKVLEFNVRFGDPECQVILARFSGDLLGVMMATVDGHLAEIEMPWDERAAVCVVMAAGGYPGAYEKGQVIEGLERLRDWSGGMVFHAGTARRDGRVVTAGGRVLGVTALGADIAAAVTAAYAAADQITWPGAHYRRDIAYRALGAVPLKEGD
jgi:phosphoribosylamine--glycine ligase